MNFFESLDAKRKLLRSRIVPTWVSFRAAVTDLTASYNESEIGKLLPARIEKSTGESSVLISREGGTSPDRRSLTITVCMSLKQEVYAIEVTAEEWIAGTTTKTRAFNLPNLVLDADDSGDTWLSVKEGDKVSNFDPFHAAEHILKIVLLTEPPPLEYTEVVIFPRVSISSI